MELLSASTRKLLDLARQEAWTRGRRVLGTEYVAYALVVDETEAASPPAVAADHATPCTALYWLAKHVFPELPLPQGVAALRKAVRDQLERHPLFTCTAAPAHPSPAEMPLSSTLEHVLIVATRIGSSAAVATQGGCQASETKKIEESSTGMVTSMCVVAALLAVGRGLGTAALMPRSACERATGMALQELGVTWEALGLGQACPIPHTPPLWAELRRDFSARAGSGKQGRGGGRPGGVGGKLGAGRGAHTPLGGDVGGDFGPPGAQPLLTPHLLPDPTTLPLAPTDQSNWLLPGRLLIGTRPNTHAVAALRVAGIDTLVCLLGEVLSVDLYASSMGPDATCDDIIFFPIGDFEVTSSRSLVALVVELKRRLLSGHNVYVHCRGGHGRTGLVVVPLIAALCDVSTANAREFVETATQCGRREDHGWHWEMPETEEQQDLACYIEAAVRGHPGASGGEG